MGKRARFEEREEDEVSDVEVTFLTYNVDEADYHTVKRFLSYALGHVDSNLDLSLLAGWLTGELGEFVGTTVKQEEDGPEGDAFAFSTLVPIHSSVPPKYQRTINALKAFLVKKTGNAKLFPEDKRNAFVLHERLVNMPEGIGAPVLKQLWDDWQEAIKEDPHLFDKIDNLVLLTPIYREVDEEEKEDSETVLKYFYEEFEAIGEQQFWDFEVQAQADSRRVFGERGSVTGRRVIVFNAKQFEAFVKTTNTEHQ